MLIRNVRRSFYDKLKSMLQSPPAGTFSTGWNVYTEKNMKDSTFVPVRPFVYFVDKDILPTASRMPLIALETGQMLRTPYEIGNRSGHIVMASINIFAESRGQRDDLLSFFQDNMPLTVNITDYYTAGSPVAGHMELMDEPTVMLSALGEGEDIEGTLRNYGDVQTDWIIVS